MKATNEIALPLDDLGKVGNDVDMDHARVGVAGQDVAKVIVALEVVEGKVELNLGTRTFCNVLHERFLGVRGTVGARRTHVGGRGHVLMRWMAHGWRGKIDCMEVKLPTVRQIVYHDVNPTKITKRQDKTTFVWEENRATVWQSRCTDGMPSNLHRCRSNRATLRIRSRRHLHAGIHRDE